MAESNEQVIERLQAQIEFASDEKEIALIQKKIDSLQETR